MKRPRSRGGKPRRQDVSFRFEKMETSPIPNGRDILETQRLVRDILEMQRSGLGTTRSELYLPFGTK